MVHATQKECTPLTKLSLKFGAITEFFIDILVSIDRLCPHSNNKPSMPGTLETSSNCKVSQSLSY